MRYLTNYLGVNPMSNAQEFADMLRCTPAFKGIVTIHVLPMDTLSVSHQKHSHKKPLSWNDAELAKTSFEQIREEITKLILS
jgi:hypothetical protein